MSGPAGTKPNLTGPANSYTSDDVNLFNDFEGGAAYLLDRILASRNALLDKAKQCYQLHETSGVYAFPDVFAPKVFTLQEKIEADKDKANTHGLTINIISFLKLWHQQAWDRLNGEKKDLEELKEWFQDIEFCQKPFTKKYMSLLADLTNHSSSKHNERRNCQAILAFFQMDSMPSFNGASSIYADIKACELNIKIQDDNFKLAPECSALRKIAEEEISRYHERYDGQEFRLLKEAKEQFFSFSAHISEPDWSRDDKQKKRFFVFKALVDKMTKFAEDAGRCKDGPKVFELFCQTDNMGQKKLESFLMNAFNLLSIFFETINEVNSMYPLVCDLACMTLDSWSAIIHGIKTSAAELKNCLVRSANEAATRWLQSEISGFCHDVCTYTSLQDRSSRYSEQELKPRFKPFAATGMARSSHLAVDMHSECQDLIGMRVWYVDAVPSGDFNQYSPTNSTCGVMIVHIFLRNNIAISRLNDHAEKMQAKIPTENNNASRNVQLPSWLQDACVSRLFYQPLLDFLIDDFDRSLNENGSIHTREPVRLVFTGSALDAVLATVVASELLKRFNSYREDRLISKHHSHSDADWDILYNHVRSSVFVLSFMLPAVFSGPHLSPHQLSSKGRRVDGDKQTPHGAIGVHMLNITVSNCIAVKLVEHWLSVDRSDVAHKAAKEFQEHDRIVIETLQKLFSICKKTPTFSKSVEDAMAKVVHWAHDPKRPKLPNGTFAADFKGKVQSSVSFQVQSSVSFRLVNSPKITRCKTVQEKTREKSAFVKVGETVIKAGDKAVDFFSHHIQQTDEWWHGCLALLHVDPIHLLSCTSERPCADREIMNSIASWFVPVATVYEVSEPRAFSVPFVHREKASYGTLNASDIRIPKLAKGRRDDRTDAPDGQISEVSEKCESEKPKGPKERHPSDICMRSRISVKPVGSRDSRRLMIQCICDSKDSHALIRNCFAVTVTVVFDSQRSQNYDTFEIQTEEFLNSDLKVSVSEHDYESLYSLQCEADIPIPASCNSMTIDEVIQSTSVFAVMRMRFFSAQFGYGHPAPSNSDVGVSHKTYNGLGPELFCFPKRLPMKQPQLADEALLFWFWFYWGRLRPIGNALDFLNGFQEMDKTLTDKILKKIDFDRFSDLSSPHSSSCPPRLHFRKLLNLDNFYKKHKFYFEGCVPNINTAHDVVFCDFEIQDPDKKTFNSRYLHMRLDELLMQAWDFKLLALNAYGRNADLQACNFPECDALIQNCDDLCDLIAQTFRGSQWWSSKLLKKCGGCDRMDDSVVKKRNECRRHLYDYLNDDEEGLEYVCKQSSYLRRCAFSKSVFNKIETLFKEQQATGEPPTQRFYLSIADCMNGISDAHSLMVKLVSFPKENNPSATLMTERSYNGIYNAFFVPPTQPSTTLQSDDRRVLPPRFPVNLYDNEKFAIGQKQDYRHFPTSDVHEGDRAIPACSLVSNPTSKSHHFRSLFRVLETGAQKEGGWNCHRTEAEFTSCEIFDRCYVQ
jgi:hypothetical protein